MQKDQTSRPVLEIPTVTTDDIHQALLACNSQSNFVDGFVTDIGRVRLNEFYQKVIKNDKNDQAVKDVAETKPSEHISPNESLDIRKMPLTRQQIISVVDIWQEFFADGKSKFEICVQPLIDEINNTSAGQRLIGYVKNVETAFQSKLKECKIFSSELDRHQKKIDLYSELILKAIKGIKFYAFAPSLLTNSTEHRLILAVFLIVIKSQLFKFYTRKLIFQELEQKVGNSFMTIAQQFYDISSFRRLDQGCYTYFLKETLSKITYKYPPKLTKADHIVGTFSENFSVEQVEQAIDQISQILSYQSKYPEYINNSSALIKAIVISEAEDGTRIFNTWRTIYNSIIKDCEIKKACRHKIKPHEKKEKDLSELLGTYIDVNTPPALRKFILGLITAGCNSYECRRAIASSQPLAGRRNVIFTYPKLYLHALSFINPIVQDDSEARSVIVNFVENIEHFWEKDSHRKIICLSLANFFLSRSCKYLSTNIKETKLPRLVVLNNIFDKMKEHDLTISDEIGRFIWRRFFRFLLRNDFKLKCDIGHIINLFEIISRYGLELPEAVEAKLSNFLLANIEKKKKVLHLSEILNGIESIKDPESLGALLEFFTRNTIFKAAVENITKYYNYLFDHSSIETLVTTLPSAWNILLENFMKNHSPILAEFLLILPKSGIEAAAEQLNIFKTNIYLISYLKQHIEIKADGDTEYYKDKIKQLIKDFEKNVAWSLAEQITKGAPSFFTNSVSEEGSSGEAVNGPKC